MKDPQSSSLSDAGFGVHGRTDIVKIAVFSIPIGAGGRIMVLIHGKTQHFRAENHQIAVRGELFFLDKLTFQIEKAFPDLRGVYSDRRFGGQTGRSDLIGIVPIVLNRAHTGGKAAL